MTVSHVNHEEYHHPWLVAVWPGMGNVAVTAGYYLMSKLGMHLVAEVPGGELFDIESVEVRDGIIRKEPLPRSRFYLWSDPQKRRDLVVFLGEAQPPAGRNSLCAALLQYAREIKAERVITFAAMATQMHPTEKSRVFAAATSKEVLDQLREQDLEVLEEGRISGLNGSLLGEAADEGFEGCCLMGEMPHIFSQIPFPKAALSVLTVFSALADMEVQLVDLMEEAHEMDAKLGVVLSRIEEAIREQHPEAAQRLAREAHEEPRNEESELSLADHQRIEKLFAAAGEDRTKAYELKKELDRCGVFAQFEDRFLDLFEEFPGNEDAEASPSE